MRRNVIYLLLAIVASFLVSLFLYVLFHEGGHALVGALFGGKITELNLNFWDMSAHAGIDGDFTRPQQALISVAGVSVPLLAWFLVANFLPRKQNPVAGLFTLFLTMIAVNPLLAWVLLPIMTLFGERPGDDSVNFLGYTGVHPLVVTAVALLIYVGAIAWYLKRLGGVQVLRATLRGETVEIDAPAPRRTLAGLWIGVAAVAALGLATGAFANGGAFYGDPYRVPEGFTLLAEVDLSQQAYTDADLASFALGQPTLISLFVNPRQLNATYLDLELVGPDGQPMQILHGEGYRASNDRMQMSWELDPGNYSIVLTSDQEPGVVAIYWKQGQ
ncbi:MAG TPA: M50 family metallopeptidase [Anaerolineaceae bacterium]|nr:M50 family metallopeptidase [Anaerolineaceae bacterium]